MKTLARPRDKVEILDRLSSVTLSSERRWGRMTAGEMICHLADACRMAMGDKPVSGVSSLTQRTVVKWVAFYLPRPWPQGVLVTVPEIGAGTGGTTPGAFSADITELARIIDRFTTSDAVGWPAHPIFGRLSRREWMRWGYLHTDHHLRQFGA
jgi:hypothetical protein